MPYKSEKNTKPEAKKPCDKTTQKDSKLNIKSIVKSKNNIRVAIVALVLIGAIISSIALFSSCSSNSVVSLSRDFVIKDGGKTYFSGYGILFDISDYNNPHPLSDENADSQVLLMSEKSCFDDDTIYSVYAKEQSLIKYTVKDGNVESEVWVDSTTLKNKFNNLLNNKSRNATDIYDLSICDGYVFFYYNPVVENSSADIENAYRIGKISLDGSEIEFFNSDIRASSLITKGDYVYYYDNGYSLSHTDFDRAGIYRMKSDGSDKELLFNDFGKIDTTLNAPMLCNNFKIFGDYLYFIADTSTGRSRVCKLALDGSSHEYLTKNGAHRYTLDIENNILYYSEGDMQKVVGEPRSVYKATLDNNKESSIFKVDGNREFTVSDNHLYITDCYHFPMNVGSYSILGERYDTENNTIEFLCGEKIQSDIVYDPQKDVYVYQSGSSNDAKYYWSKTGPYTTY